MVSLALLPNLTSVDFGGANWVTAPLLKRLATACPKLRSLDLQRCPTVTDADISGAFSQENPVLAPSLHDVFNSRTQQCAVGFVGVDLSQNWARVAV